VALCSFVDVCAADTVSVVATGVIRFRLCMTLLLLSWERERWCCRCVGNDTVCLIYTTLRQSSSISGGRQERKRWWGLVQYGGILDGFTFVGILYTCIIALSEFFTVVIDSCLIFKHIKLNDVRGCEIVQATVALVKALQRNRDRFRAS
jgi:hypothetical protein